MGFALLFILPNGSGPGATVNPQPSGKAILRLSYRAASYEGASRPYTVSFFDTEAGTHVGGLVGTDGNGSIFISDPLTRGSCLLKRFDRRGKLIGSWGPIAVNAIESVVVTNDGLIWAALEEDSENQVQGLPFIALRVGKQKPLIDWRKEIPQSLKEKVTRALDELKLKWDTGWRVFEMHVGENNVGILAHGRAVGGENGITRELWMLLGGDGELADTKVIRPGQPLPLLDPMGEIWFRLNDFEAKGFTWNRLWLWPSGQPRGTPLIDRTSEPEPWSDHITLGKPNPPQTRIDARGQIYLDFLRADTKAHKRRFVVEDKVIYEDYGQGGANGERALVVLDRNRKYVTSTGWIPTSVEICDGWVKPLPDGSGFYRIQFMEKEAVVYFHALPK